MAQRTTRLKFGPLVYLLPIYHPLRLIERHAQRLRLAKTGVQHDQLLHAGQPRLVLDQRALQR